MPTIISSANSNTAVGGCVAGSGADTIDIAGLSAVNLTLGELVVNSDITIEGHGQLLRRENATEGRLFKVSGNAANLTINDWRMIRGKTIEGGAFYVGPGATLNLNRSAVSSATTAPMDHPTSKVAGPPIGIRCASAPA